MFRASVIIRVYTKKLFFPPTLIPPLFSPPTLILPLLFPSHHHTSFKFYFNNLPSSVKTSFAAAKSINFFSASAFSVSSVNLSGCSSRASFLYALFICCLLAFLRYSWLCTCNTNVIP